MLHSNQGLAHDTFCDNDLKCICQVDNHLGTNKLFSSDCLLKECTDGHGRRCTYPVRPRIDRLTVIAFLRDWLESCRQAGKSGWDDMPWEWEPYLPNDGEIVIRPSSFLNAPAVITSVKTPLPSSVPVLTTTAAVATSIPVNLMSTSSIQKTILLTSVASTFDTLSTTTIATSSAASPSPEATSPSPAPIVVTSRTLSPGAIGGIVTGILALAVLCAGLGYFYWKSNKKAKRKTREVAILSDRVSGCGFQKYIDDLLVDSNTNTTLDSNSSTGTIIRHPAPNPGTQEITTVSTSAVDGVRSESSSVYSVEIARAV
jgi:hypothetical protein